MTSWESAKLMKFQVGIMTSRQNGNLIKCQSDETTNPPKNDVSSCRFQSTIPNSTILIDSGLAETRYHFVFIVSRDNEDECST